MVCMAVPSIQLRRPAPALRLYMPERVLLIGLGLGWCVDTLFYGQRLGVSVPLFVLLLLGSLVALGWAERVRPARRNLWLIAPLLFFSAMVAVRANPFLTTLNVFAVLWLLGLLAFFYADDRIERLTLPGYGAILALVVRWSLVAAVPPAAAFARLAWRRRTPHWLVGPIARGLLLALPILLLFTLLLSAADRVFADLVHDLTTVHLPTDMSLLWRIVIGLSAAWLLAGGLVYALSRRPRLVPDEHPPGVLVPRVGLGVVEATTVLTLIDLLFLVFDAIQVVYVFGGHAQRTMDFEAYRLYARRGFGELVCASVLTMLLILSLRALTRFRRPREVLLFSTLATVMVGLALLLLASAFQRMLVWESVEFYVHTEVRIYVRWFIVWLALTFAWLLVALWFRHDRFAIGGFIAGLGFLATVNLANPDADVAAYNLGRHDDLSVRFLWKLSDDAVPELLAGLDRLQPPYHAQLRDELTGRLHALEWQEDQYGWPSTHLARAQALALLREARAEGRFD
jgi:hypothetical protein